MLSFTQAQKLRKQKAGPRSLRSTSGKQLPTELWMAFR